ncbi:MAG: hypothetical protein MRY21_04815 [Simkaniaceae bacterium]|nr:hypothetical protein [Simkaniaceae bacterium]
MHKKEVDLMIKLMGALDEKSDPQVNEILIKALSFFADINTKLKKANKDERKELTEVLRYFRSELNRDLPKVKKGANMSDEELDALTADPEYFTTVQRSVFDELKRVVGRSVDALTEPEPAKKPAKSSKKGGKKGGKSKKTWVRS